MKILGIETSCDETSAAIVEDMPAGRQGGLILLSHVVASSAKLHQKYGGIVPEVAARKQVEVIIPVLTEALQLQSTMKQWSNETMASIDAIAVTVGPGLIGSLLVGVETAKTLAMVWHKPIIPVNHVLAHIYAVFINSDRQRVISEKENFYSSSAPKRSREVSLKRNEVSSRLSASGGTSSNNNINFPAIALVVSGGHTELYLMKDIKSLKWLGGTLDDAAGEAFDKTARLLGLPYPGGPAIATMAAKLEIRNSKSEIKLPRPMIKDNSLNFSFSGLKTAVLREWKKFAHHPPQLVSAFAYEVQESITDVLVTKTLKAAQIYHAKSVIVGGGVAANKRLTEKFNYKILNLKSKISLFVPPPHLCVDSASYIATYAFFNNNPLPWPAITANPALSVEV